VSSPSVTIGLIDPQSPVNVGAVLRAAGCFRVSEVLYSGPRFDRAKRFHTDPQLAIRTVSLVGVDSLLESAPAGAKIVCVDLVEGATPLPEFTHPEIAFYIFGPEDGTVDQQIVDRADAVVYIPTVGSLNLAATVNVVLYDRLAKVGAKEVGDALIRRSRDRNNRVRVPALRGTPRRPKAK